MRRLRLTSRDDEILLFLYRVSFYATSKQIAERFFKAVKLEYRLQAVWRRMTKLKKAGFVRSIEQPIFRSEGGSKPLIWTLDKRGAKRVATRIDIRPNQIDTRPRAREHNLSYMEHDLGIVEYYLALRRSCIESGVELVQWTKDHLLQKEPDVVEITHDDGSSQQFGLVADASYVLRMRGRRAHHFLEYDRATVTVSAAKWTDRSWRRKFLGYLALLDSGKLKERYDTKKLWVMVVIEGGEGRLKNLVEVAGKVAGDSACFFWFTTTERMVRAKNLDEREKNNPPKNSKDQHLLSKLEADSVMAYSDGIVPTRRVDAYFAFQNAKDRRIVKYPCIRNILEEDIWTVGGKDDKLQTIL